MKKFFFFILLAIMCIGCAPKQFVPFEPPKVEFERTPSFVLDTSSIKKPDKLNPMFVDDSFKVVPIEQAKYVVLTPSEYSKIGTIVQIAATYKQIATEEEILINLHINTINSLKEYVELERLKSLQYRELWVNAENNYRYEKWEHDKSSFFYQSGMYAISFGSLVSLFFLAI